MRNVQRFVCMAAGLCLAIGGTASAITVTGTLDGPTLEAALVNAGSGLSVNSFTVSGHTLVGAPGHSAGTYTNGSGTYGVGPGMVISSGVVQDYNDGPNLETGRTTGFFVPATAAQEALLDPITGGGLDHFDVTQIDINFDMDPGFDTVFFNVVFGSDEFDEFVGSTFIDAFGMYVNGVNVAFVDGLPINIDHPDMAFTPGTELDGILTNVDGVPGPLVHQFGAVVGDGSLGNTLTFIIADSGDSSLDSTAYISQVGGPPPPPPDGAIPEPATAALGLLSLGAVGLVTRRRRRA